MSTPTHDITIYKGLTFEGLSIICLDASGSPVVQDAGTTYLCQVRTAPGKPMQFALTVTRGTQASGQIVMAEVSATNTAAFPAGTFVYDIVPIGTDSKPWAPLVRGQLTVSRPVSLPS